MPQFELPKITISPLVPADEVWVFHHETLAITDHTAQKWLLGIHLVQPQRFKIGEDGRLKLLKPEQEG